MKKCPNCQKEFPDSMRFCQTDGTPLGDPIVEAPADDPLKTTIVRQEDIFSSIPSDDSLKTMMANSSPTDDSGDLLQLPEEFDPMKTMVVAPIVKETPKIDPPKPEMPKFESIKDEIKAETPSSPFSGFSQPSEPLPTPPDISDDPTVLQPEPPKFNQPNLSPPNFGNLSSKDDAEEDNLPATMIQNSWDAETPPSSNWSDSPFSKPNNEPIPTPFDVPSLNETKVSPENESQSPFGQTPQSPFESPKSPFDAPQPSYNEPKPIDLPTPNYQEPPQQQFGSGQFGQMNEQPFGNQPLQQNDWNPPPAPSAGWQDQGLGAQTPFQPPVAMQGQNQTLALASIICGVVSLLFLGGLIIPFVNLVCGIVSPGLGLAAIITGFLARGRAKQNPNQYGGSGLALGGIITGALSILAVIGLFILAIVAGFMYR